LGQSESCNPCLNRNTGIDADKIQAHTHFAVDEKPLHE